MFLQKLVKSFRRPHASGGKDPGEAHPRDPRRGEAEPSCPPLEGAGGAAPCGRRAVSSRRRPSVGEGSREERIWWGRARVLLRKRGEWRWLFAMQRRVGGEIKVELARSFVRSRVAQASGVQAGSPLLFRTVAVAGSPAMRSFFLLLSINLQTYHVCVEYGWRSIIAQATHTMPQRIVSSQQIRVVWCGKPLCRFSKTRSRTQHLKDPFRRLIAPRSFNIDLCAASTLQRPQQAAGADQIFGCHRTPVNC